MDISSLTYTDWVLIGSLLALVLYKLGTWNHDYFKTRGITTYKTVPFYGSMARTAFRIQSFGDLQNEMCKLTDDKLVGFMQFYKPILVVKSPDLIKQVTVKDFEHFMDHQQTITEEADPIFTKNLFSLRGEKWRDMRNTLSPAFTTSKMKNMFNFMNDCGMQLEEYLQREVAKQQPGEPYTLEMKELFTKFTNDVIATSAFGLHIDSLKETDNAFYKMGKDITNFGGIKSLIFLGFLISPKLMELLGLGFFSKKEADFFKDLVHETVTAREKHGIVRPDMIHLLMQARKGELKAELDEGETITNGVAKAKKTKLTEDDIVAQAMIFFFAGFDTASTLLAFTSMLLATNEDVQRRLQEEIDDVMGEDQKLTYEKVQNMKYLDMVIAESLRKYPPAVLMDRLCVKDYTFPEINYTIKKGQALWIPVYGIHHNPEYYPEPEKFDPERFSDENKQNIKPYTYLPFGVGPRLCIGQRFALLEAKVALIHILSRFNLVVVDKTPLPLRLTSNGFVMAIAGGFWTGVTPRQKIST